MCGRLLRRLGGRLDSAQQLEEKAIGELNISNALQPLTLVHAALSSILTARGDLQSAKKQLSEAVQAFLRKFRDPWNSGAPSCCSPRTNFS